MKHLSISLLHTAWTAEEKKQIEDTLEFVENYPGSNFLKDACLYLYRLLKVDYILVTIVEPLPHLTVNSVVLLKEGVISENITYPLGGSPCEGVYGKEQNYYPAGIQDFFPDNELLAKMQVKSYFGVPLFNQNEKELGCLAILHSNIIERGGFVEALIQVMLPRLEEELYKSCGSVKSRKAFIRRMNALVK